jgi:hypothetical protein
MYLSSIVEREVEFGVVAGDGPKTVRVLDAQVFG